MCKSMSLITLATLGGTGRLALTKSLYIARSAYQSSTKRAAVKNMLRTALVSFHDDFESASMAYVIPSPSPSEA